ncbi:MAG: DUF4255 domain-containing protein [Chloroflexota bacterium]
MFHDLNNSIEKLVTNDLNRPDVHIRFVTPDKIAKIATSIEKPSVNFFLYDVRENHDLSIDVWRQERLPNGVVQRHQPPVQIECAYLVSVWVPNDDEDTGASDEYRLLGEVMKILMRYRILPYAVLQGELKDKTPPVRAQTIQPGGLQSLSEFWQTIGNKPKASLNYTVRLSVELAEPEDLEVPVIQSVISIRQGVEDDL